MEHENFLDELLAEAEAQEEQLTEAHYDLILAEIRTLTEKMENNFRQSEIEQEIVQNWALEKNTKHQERIEYLARKLESYIRERDVKTLDLPNGTLKIRKKPDKVEVKDLDKFLKNARPEMLSVVPEEVKPDLNKIKTWMKMSSKVPEGCELIKGKEEFSYKLKEVNTNGRTSET